MNNNEYDRMPGIRRSDLWKINKTPFHFKYAMDNPEEPTRSLLFGTASHKMILEPDDFWNEYAIAPAIDKRSKAGKEEWAKFIEDCAITWKEPITQDDLECIERMAKVIEQDQIASALLRTGRHEVPFFWTDDITGEPCKCKPDVLTEYGGKKYIVDYKTTESCEDGRFESACKKYGYKLQAGMYTEGVFQNTFEQYGFAFVVQEKSAPYAVRVYFCTPEFVAQGYDKFRELIGLYHMCRVSDTWPGYPQAELLEDVIHE